MLVNTTTNRPVYLINKDPRANLIDMEAHTWTRHPERDDLVRNLAAYSRGDETILLTVDELKRVVAGVKAMQEVESFDEACMFLQTLPRELQLIARMFGHREIDQALLTNSPSTTLRKMAQDIRDKRIAKEKARKAQEAALAREATKTPPAPKKPKKTPPKKQEVHGVVLTEKQIQFLQAVPEKKYLTTTDMKHALPEMSGMALGAIISTLREKKLLTTEKTGGNAHIEFTDLGKEVIKCLVSR